MAEQKWMLAVALLGWLACTSKPETLLQVERLIGSTPEELTGRLGEPKEHREESKGNFGFLRWNDVEGVQVLVVIRQGKGCYVSYQFKNMDPFDEKKALALIGAELPKAAPEAVPRSRAKRWMPFGPFERLTINPDTRLISVGTHPSFLVKPEDEALPPEPGPTETG